jgi:hypothetical protein
MRWRIVFRYEHKEALSNAPYDVSFARVEPTGGYPACYTGKLLVQSMSAAIISSFLSTFAPPLIIACSS